MQHRHMLQDGRAIIRYNRRILRLNHLVHPLWAQTRSNGISNS